MDRQAINAWRWGLALTVPSALWLIDSLAVWYRGPWTHVVLPVFRLFAPISLVAAIAAPFTALIPLIILVRFRRVGWGRSLCLLVALVCSVLAGVQIWWNVVLVSKFHD